MIPKHFYNNLTIKYIWQIGEGEQQCKYTYFKYKNDATILGDIIELPYSPEFIGYKWNTKPDGTGQTYTPGQVVTLTCSLALYAQFEYYVPYKSSNGLPIEPVNPSQFFRGQPYIRNEKTGINDFRWVIGGITNNFEGENFIKRIDNTLIAGNWTFNHPDKLTEIVIPDYVEFLQRDIFSYLSNLKVITFGTGFNDVEQNVFINCTGLEKVKISSLDQWLNLQFKSITANPFNASDAKLYINDQELTTLIIPEDSAITEIKKYAFYNYKYLQGITIRKEISSIGTNAITKWDLGSLYLVQHTPPSISNSTFEGVTCINHALWIPATAETSYRNDPNWSQFYIRPYTE